MSIVKIELLEQKGDNYFDPVHVNHNHTEPHWRQNWGSL